MKIAYFLDMGFGGSGNLLIQRAALMSSIHDVIVVIPADASGNYNVEYADRCKAHNMTYVCIRYSTSTNFRYIDFLDCLYGVGCIEEFMKEERITFIHSAQLNIAVEYVSRKLRIPHLMDIYQLRREEFTLCPGDIYPHYHLCDSMLYANRWSSQLNIESRCIRPVAISNYIRKKAIYSQNELKLLMLGLVCTRKNQLEAIRAVEQCCTMYKIELHIVGDDSLDYAKECKEYVKENHLERFVIFHGLISDIIPFLEKSDCLLCSSTDESFPSSVVEALTYDLTIISTPVAGIPELFIDGVNSFISKDFSAKSIEESIRKSFAYYQSGEIYSIHQNAQNIWENNFERTIIRKQIETYYSDIVRKQRFKSIDSFFSIREEIEITRTLLFGIDDMGEVWIYRKYLYYTVVRKTLKRGKIYIWGAGRLGKLAFEILTKICPELEIIAFLDKYKKGKYCNIPIIRVENTPLEKDCLYCVSFAKNRDEAICYLEDKGYVLNSQIWNIP